MKLRNMAALPFALALIGAAPPAAAATSAAAERLRAHVEFLSSDLMEGRETGTRGHEIAASYVASQFTALGLKPGGDNGSWYQQVPFRRATVKDTPSITYRAGGTSMTLKQGADIAIRPSLVKAETAVDAGLAFVGFGISDPVLGIDDYAGVDVRGKIVVALSGTPKGLRSDVAAHLGQVKPKTAAARGAVGYVELPAGAGGWPSVEAFAGRPVVSWADAKGGSGQGSAAPLVRMLLSKATAEKLCTGAPQTLAAAQAEAAAGRSP